MHARQDTSDRQDHKRIQHTGQERVTSGHLPVRVSSWQCNLIHGELVYLHRG